MSKKRRAAFFLLLILSLIGLLDSLVVYEKVYGASYVPCIVGHGCDTVLYSYYSKFLEVPLVWWGMVFYGVLALFIALRLTSGKKVFEDIAFTFVGAGFLFSLYLLHIQIFILGTLCTYCMISFSDMLFSSAIVLTFLWKRKKLPEFI